MKNLILTIAAILFLATCGKNDSWSPEDDIKDFLEANPYGVVFENGTEGDLYLECSGLATTSFPLLKQGGVSEEYRGPQSEITVEYSGERGPTTAR